MTHENIYQQCAAVLKPYVKAKLMGPLFRAPLFKALDNNLLLTCTDNDTIVAFCLLRVRKRDACLILEKIAVSAPHQGQHLGKQLLLQSLEIAREKGLTLELSVVKSNQIAVDFYQHLGLQVVGNKLIGKSQIPLLIMQATNYGERQ